MLGCVLCVDPGTDGRSVVIRRGREVDHSLMNSDMTTERAQ